MDILPLHAALALFLVPVMEHRAAGKPFLISSTALPVLVALLMIPPVATSAISRALPKRDHGAVSKQGNGRDTKRPGRSVLRF